MHAELNKLMSEARQNESKHRRFQHMELRLLEATRLPELCAILVGDYPAEFRLDRVALHLFDDTQELLRFDYARELMRLRGVYVHHRPEHRLAVHCGRRPRLGPCDARRHHDLFPGQGSPPASLAVLPLRRGDRSVGLFVLGSAHPRRFRAEDGTEFLARLAAIASVAVDNALNMERLRQAGLRDPLTGLYNRRHFDDSLRRELVGAERAGRPLGCLYCDVDHFKRINDRHGHPAGDAVLQEVATRLRRALRRSEVLARVGGEEFAVLLPGADPDQAITAAERLRAAVGTRPVALDEHRSLPVTLSCGVATLAPGPGQDVEVLAEALLGLADDALLTAKREGRDRVVAAWQPAPLRSASAAVGGRLRPG